VDILVWEWVDTLAWAWAVILDTAWDTAILDIAWAMMGIMVMVWVMVWVMVAILAMAWATAMVVMVVIIMGTVWDTVVIRTTMDTVDSTNKIPFNLLIAINQTLLHKRKKANHFMTKNPKEQLGIP
jgi:hypothetical protein